MEHVDRLLHHSSSIFYAIYCTNAIKNNFRSLKTAFIYRSQHFFSYLLQLQLLFFLTFGYQRKREAGWALSELGGPFGVGQHIKCRKTMCQRTELYYMKIGTYKFMQMNCRGRKKHWGMGSIYIPGCCAITAKVSANNFLTLRVKFNENAIIWASQGFRPSRLFRRTDNNELRAGTATDCRQRWTANVRIMFMGARSQMQLDSIISVFPIWMGVPYHPIAAVAKRCGRWNIDLDSRMDKTPVPKFELRL